MFIDAERNVAALRQVRRADRMVLTVLVEVIIGLRMIFLISLIKHLLPFDYFWFAGILKTGSSTATLIFMSVNLRVAGLNTSTSEVIIVNGSFTPPTSL